MLTRLVPIHTTDWKQWSGSNTISLYYSIMLSGVGIGDEHSKNFIFGKKAPTSPFPS